MDQTLEYIRDGIVKIVDNKSGFYGTGFFIKIKQNRYCITCHHCISTLDEIFVQRDDVKRSAEWVEEFSDMSKDIAILNVKDCDNLHIKPLLYAKEAMPKLPVLVWGFSGAKLDTFPQGSPEDGELSSGDIAFQRQEKGVKGNEKWNKKPVVNVFVFAFSGKFDVGYSGAPVCYAGNNNVIGIFTAIDNNYGYVIPIQTILERFEGKIRIIEPSSTRVNILDFIKKGTDSLHRDDYYDAIKQYDMVVKAPDYIAAFSNKGYALNELGKRNEAIQCYDIILAIDPKNVVALTSKGISLSELREYGKSTPYFDKALAIDPKNVVALLGKGTVFIMRGQFKEAIQCYDIILAIDPKNVVALTNKGTSLNELGKNNEAIECFDKALAIDPNRIADIINKGISFIQLGDTEILCHTLIKP